jgi:hypothetical protein
MHSGGYSPDRTSPAINCSTVRPIYSAAMDHVRHVAGSPRTGDVPFEHYYWGGKNWIEEMG